MAVSLTRTIGFQAMHRYHRPDWTEAENQATFGSLGHAPGHAHDYRCAVTVTGPFQAELGGVMDLRLLDRILAEEVIAPLDGRHLNLDIPEFAYGRTLATCEAVARYLFPRVAARLPTGVRLERVRIAEDETLHADCTGPA